MLYALLYPLADQFQAFNLFRYITFRSGGAVVTALLISFVLGPYLILWLRRKQTNGQPIRPDGPNGHLTRKKGTPTMGGFLILLALTISTLLWADLANPYVWIVLLVTVGFGLIGFFDDYRKLTRNSHRGLSGRAKLVLQAALGAGACVAITFVAPPGLATAVAVPFFKNVLIELGWFFVPFGILVIIGTSNAVNLTDGLDGLAIVPSMIAYSKSRSPDKLRKTLSKTPFCAQRWKRRKTEFQQPNAGGRSRHGAPVRAIHRTASINRRLSAPWRPGSPGLPASSGAICSHCRSFRTTRSTAGLLLPVLKQIFPIRETRDLLNVHRP